MNDNVCEIYQTLSEIYDEINDRPPTDAELDAMYEQYLERNQYYE